MTTNPPTLTYTLEEILSRLDQKIEKQFAEVNLVKKNVEMFHGTSLQGFQDTNLDYSEVNTCNQCGTNILQSSENFTTARIPDHSISTSS